MCTLIEWNQIYDRQTIFLFIGIYTSTSQFGVEAATE